MTDNTELKLKLSQYIARSEYIKYKRLCDSEWYCGITIKIGEELLLILRFFDFQPDGYEIIPLSQIVALRRSNSEAYFGRIVKKEGAMSLVQSAPDISLDKWKTVFEFLEQTREIGRQGDGSFVLTLS